MKFYIVESLIGERMGAETSLKAAKQRAADYGLDRCIIRTVEVQVNAETVRLMLGDMGGYVDASSEREYP